MLQTILENKYSRMPSWRSIARCLFYYATVWIILTGGNPYSWVLGIPAIVLATILNLLFTKSSPITISLSGTVRFIIFFLCQSFFSGFDVMLRALSPGLKINPGLILYATFLPAGPARIVFINTISLLPGTLSAELKNNIITVHTIDKDMPVWSNIQNLEARISVLFGKTSSQEKIS